MPKASPTTPLSCLFAINKPTGHVSMQLLNRLQPLFAASSLFAKVEDPSQANQGGKGNRKRKWKAERIKIGQGGTLDPLADGVLVIGTNNATKQLSKFLDCTKEYRAIGLFGCATDTYDSEGKRVTESAWEDVTKEKIEGVLSRFRGEIEQVPPIYSALKMDGKPLYEYARTGTPLPRPIAARKVTVSQLSLLNFTSGVDHSYQFPTESLGETEKAELEAMEKMIRDGETVVPNAVKERAKGKRGDYVAPVAPVAPIDPSVPRPPTFEISMTVSSGTYVRSIVHDIAIALGSSAFVVKLTRTRQGEFTLNDEPIVEAEKITVVEAVAEVVEPVVEVADVVLAVASTSAAAIPAAVEESLPNLAGGCIEWEVFEAALSELEAGKKGGSTKIPVEGELAEWETQLLHKCQQV